MPGSGLGLSIVRQVAERHSGTVEAGDSPSGGGARSRCGCPAPRSPVPDWTPAREGAVLVAALAARLLAACSGSAQPDEPTGPDRGRRSGRRRLEPVRRPDRGAGLRIAGEPMSEQNGTADGRAARSPR